MSNWIRALDAERLKLRRTLALTLAFVVPLSIVALQVAVLLDRGPTDGLYMDAGESAWQAFIRQNMNWWSLLMLPLFVTLEAALVASVEHSGDHWKQLFALPVSRGALYGAKQATVLALVLISLVALIGYSVLAGAAVNLLCPGVPYGWDIPWGYALGLVALVYVGSWLLVSLHTWVSLRWKSFVVPSALGIVMTVAGIMVINSDYGPYYPWTLSAVAMLEWVREGLLPLAPLAVSVIGGVAVALVGGWDVVRRDVL